MPNMVALIPEAQSRIITLEGVIDGTPDTKHTLSAAAGAEPLEHATEIVDHRVARQAEVTITAYVSDFSPGRPAQAWTQFRALHQVIEPLVVITEWGVYDEMHVTGITAEYAGRGLLATIDLKEIIRTGRDDLLPFAYRGGPAEQRAREIEHGRQELQQRLNVLRDQGTDVTVQEVREVRSLVAEAIEERNQLARDAFAGGVPLPAAQFGLDRNDPTQNPFLDGP